MMRGPIVILVGVILLAVLGPQLLFTVDQTQFAIVTRFGEPQRSITQPGLFLKTPFIDAVTYFDARLLRDDVGRAPMLTADKKNLIIDAYARYRIIDPLRFREELRDEATAATRVGDIVISELRREVALDNQSDIVSDRREEIMNQVRDAAASRARTFGIEITDVRIKRADFPDEIAQSIYGRMQAERDRIAKQFRAEGAEEDAKIRADVDKEATILLADADRVSNLIRGEAEAAAIEIFALALELNPEFYAFQRSLEAYKVFLDTNTTVVLSAESPLFQFLQDPSKR